MRRYDQGCRRTQRIIEECPFSPVYAAKDVFEDPQVAARKLLVSIDDPDVGTHHFARTPVLLSSAPGIGTQPAPRLGEHTRSILKELLGRQDEEIRRLQQNDVM